MNFSFTDRTRKVLAMAREETIRLHAERVEPEHMLLALIREGEGIAAAILTGLAADHARIREQVEARVPRGARTVSLGELPYTSRAKRVLSSAMDEARKLGHDYVGTEHLLLGVLHEQRGIAAEALEEAGVTLEDARREAVRLVGAEPSPRGTAGGGSWLRRLLGLEPERTPEQASERSRFTMAIDDASTASIYEQIIAQVQEAVATGRLQPGDRLPAVRQLADELDIAPGTVARAYGELERTGVVVTGGARGTRIAERPKNPLPDGARPETLVGLLRPVAVAAFHLGATGGELRAALEQAMRGIFPEPEGEEPSPG